MMSSGKCHEKSTANGHNGWMDKWTRDGLPFSMNGLVMDPGLAVY